MGLCAMCKDWSSWWTFQKWANDWSLTPGRYVGVAPEEVDEDFDFEEALRDIHVELAGLNDEAVELAAKISKNFEELGA